MTAITEENQLIGGGAFLIQDSDPTEIFVPEDFSEEQRMDSEYGA